jgi:predicted nucleic acid-binding protein
VQIRRRLLLNGHASPEAVALRELIEGEDDICTCGVIVTEVFQGLRRQRGVAEFGALFRELTFLEPSGIAPYFRAAELYRALRGQGRTVRSTIDCILAVLAEESGCHLLAKDRDLTTILGSDLVRVRAFPVDKRVSPPPPRDAQ